MKTKILVVSLLSVLFFSFTPFTEIDTQKITQTPLVSIVENTSHITASEVINDEVSCSFQIQIFWTGDAEFGVPGYQAVRNARRAYYETLGKHPLANIVNNNSEIWTFNYRCDDQRVNDLRATIEEDPDVCADTTCDD